MHRKAFTGLVAVLLFAGLVCVLAPDTALAQDPAKIAPNNYKCTFENERTRVCEVRVKPGEKIAMHSHPDHLVYAMDAGKLKFSYPDGKTQEAETKAGEVIWTKAESHAAENVGTADLRVLVVELKEPARKKVAGRTWPAKKM